MDLLLLHPRIAVSWKMSIMMWLFRHSARLVFMKEGLSQTRLHRSPPDPLLMPAMMRNAIFLLVCCLGGALWSVQPVSATSASLVAASDTTELQVHPPIRGGAPTLLETAYEEAQAIADTEPLHAALLLHPFWGDMQSSTSALHERAQTLLHTAVQDGLDAERKAVQSHTDALHAPSVEALNEAQRQRQHLASLAHELETYWEATPDAKNRFTQLQNDLDDAYHRAVETYEEDVLEPMLYDSYGNAQLVQSLALLSRMLLDASIDGDTTPPTLEANRVNDACYEAWRAELQDMNALDAFYGLLHVVNANIEVHQIVFDEHLMRHLRFQRPGAPEPYYEILAAVQAERAGEQIEHIDRAMEKAPHVPLLNQLHRWRATLQNAYDTPPMHAQQLMTQAQRMYHADALSEAQDLLAGATRVAPTYAPAHYQHGQVAYANHDMEAAYDHLQKTIDHHPNHEPAQLRLVDVLLDKDKPEAALRRAEALLEKQSLWLACHRTAQALHATGAYTDGISLIRGRCEPLNRHWAPLYVTLGHLYAATEDWHAARQAYQEAAHRVGTPSDLEAHINRLYEKAAAADGLSPEDLSP